MPPGGNWRDLPEDLKQIALGGAFVSWGGRTGFLRRLSWDQPCPTLNTDPDQKATSLCHPDEDRPLSIPEYARIQGFPAGWVVVGGMASKYRQLGNAVPVGLARALGTAILTARQGNARREKCGRVECHDLALLDSLAGRYRTRLNPPRMRLPTGRCSDRWNDGKPRLRDDGSAFAPPHLMGAVGKTKMAKRIAEKLKALYGASDLGHFEDPVDKLFFILLSQRSAGSTYERVFSSFKEWAFDWDAIVHRNAADVVDAVARAGLGPRKSGYVLAIADLLHRKFGRVTLEPLKARPDAEVLDFLTALPGVGLKTAKCVMMFNMDREVLPVDAHVARVAGRIGLMDPSASGSRTAEVLEAVIPRGWRREFHVNALAHGQALCAARNPKCGECPLSRSCAYGGRRSRLRAASPGKGKSTSGVSVGGLPLWDRSREQAVSPHAPVTAVTPATTVGNAALQREAVV